MKNKLKFYKQAAKWIKQAEEESMPKPVKPFEFPGLAEAQDANAKTRSEILGYEHKNTLPGNIMEYGIPVAIGADAAGTMANPKRFDWNALREQARARARAAKEKPMRSATMTWLGRGMNGVFVPTSTIESVRHGKNALTSEEPVEKRVAEGGLAVTDGAIALSALGQLMASNPALAIRAANGARGAGIMWAPMSLASSMGPLMLAEYALEKGVEEREILDRGLKVYNSDQLGTTLNAILKYINNNRDEFGDITGESPRELAPATVWYTNRAVQNANNFTPPYKPNSPGILYHNPVAMVPRGLRPSNVIEAARQANSGILWPMETIGRTLDSTARFYGNMLQREGHEWVPWLFRNPGGPELDAYAAGKVAKQQNAINSGFQSLEAMQNNQELQEELPDRVKYIPTPKGVELRLPQNEAIPIEKENTSGDQVVNTAVSQAYNNTPILAGSSGGLIGDIHKMGKKPKVETESWGAWLSRKAREARESSADYPSIMEPTGGIAF